ncbi:MAG: AAA family ATPase [Bacteroidia bacterium]|nr:AAA family ATPase [Bacteroidia bacterium]MCX7764065.1 AAA family ATPase [Bacteroidia bacterium]MDW8058044.1 AAA family ATPase [Bacteroidia bacterium]
MLLEQLVSAAQKVVIGQREPLEHLWTALIAGGHVLLEGVPGVAKTLMASTLAHLSGLEFRRVQFTPDMLPSDLTGGIVYEGPGRFSVRKGPIFTQVLLADEVNRAPAKVQSALLESMQEGQVTLGEETHALPKPFWVLATQNPIEQEGTYALPEAQVDRFLFRVEVGYPSVEEEEEILRRWARHLYPEPPPPLLSPKKILDYQEQAKQVEIAPRLEKYIVRLVRATRMPEEAGIKGWQDKIAYGASPRAALALHRAARARAFLLGRTTVLPEDIKAVAPAVLRHRIILSYAALAEGIRTDAFIQVLLSSIPY